jgi:HAD superfamily hydrolase (TIGR01484 family)
MKLIQHTHLIVSDIEGCLSAGKGLLLDLGTLQVIQLYNLQAKKGVNIPLAFCTGRPQPFVEAFCQMLGIVMPCVCENGAFIYDPVRDVSIRNPAITEQHIDAQKEFVRVLESKLAKKYPYRYEPGKEICISLNPDVSKERYAEEIPRLYEQIKNLIDSSLFTVTHSSSAVDITPARIDKASGIRFLAELTGIPLQEMAGIGDTIGDLPFLSITGISAAPANCSSVICASVDYVSQKSAAEGVLDIITCLNQKTFNKVNLSSKEMKK